MLSVAAFWVHGMLPSIKRGARRALPDATRPDHVGPPVQGSYAIRCSRAPRA